MEPDTKQSRKMDSTKILCMKTLLDTMSLHIVFECNMGPSPIACSTTYCIAYHQKSIFGIMVLGAYCVGDFWPTSKTIKGLAD